MIVVRALLYLARLRGLAPRIISGRGDEDPYLTRYYLLGNRKGIAKDEDQKGFGLYLHHFHRSDDAGDLHSHPWAWAISLILKGGYLEEYIAEPFGKVMVWGKIRRRELRAGMFNRLTAETYHRVDLHLGDTWTLFFTGPRVSSWGFVKRVSRMFVPWRQYLGLEGKS